MRYVFLLIALFLVCVNATASANIWVEDFSGYNTVSDLSAPWTSVSKMYVVADGYTGTGISINGNDSYANLGQAFRATGDANTNYVYARIKLAGNGSIQGGMSLGLQSYISASAGNLTGDYIQLQAYKSSDTLSKIYFYTNPGGSATYNGDLTITSDDWWDIKLEKVGTNWVGSAKLSSGGSWTTIGTASGTSIPSTFVPNYVGITGCYNNSVMDDVDVATLHIEKANTPTYSELTNGPLVVKKSWNLTNCGFQTYASYQGQNVTNLIAADTYNALNESWAFMTVQQDADVDKFVNTGKPVAVYGLIPNIVNHWVNGNVETNRYLDYINTHVTSGYSIGVCEWENWFYRSFADTTDTKAIFGYSHEEMSSMTKDQIYQIIRNTALVWKTDARNKMMMANGFGLLSHLAGDLGADLIGIETSENIPSTQLKRAMARGAARQFGTPWFEEVSAWYNGMITAGHPTKASWPYSPGVQYGGDAGHSMSHMKRIWYSSWFSGAGHIMQEASAQVFYESPWTDPESVPANPTLSRFGIEAKAAATLWRQFDRGVPYTPFLILIGKSSGRWTMVEKPFGLLQPNSADLMFNKFIDQLYINQSAGVGNEERYLCASPYGDTFDVMINDANRNSWSSYPVIFALGDISWRSADVTKLTEYVNNGGILVINELNAAGLESIATVSEMLTNQYAVLKDSGTIVLAQKNLGSGKVYMSRNLDTVSTRQEKGYPKELLESLYKAYVPFQVSGNVETLINKTPTGWAIMIMNNDGIIKTSPNAPVIDSSKTHTVTISYDGSGGTVSEVFGRLFSQSKSGGKTKLTFTIAPGEISLFRINN